MIRDRLNALRTVMIDALATRNPDAPAWVYGPLAHSLYEVEEMIDGIEEDPSSLAGAQGIVARAEIAIEMWRAWSHRYLERRQESEQSATPLVVLHSRYDSRNAATDNNVGDAFYAARGNRTTEAGQADRPKRRVEVRTRRRRGSCEDDMSGGDGGKPTGEAKVLVEELVKAARNARKPNTRDEPRRGSRGRTRQNGWR